MENTFNALTERLDACLPQTQCTRCGFPCCRAYAEALAAGTSELNRCPPGGNTTLSALAAVLQRPALPLDPTCGPNTRRTLAVIDEARCIGCRKCIDACPVDAIVGARKLMHTVLNNECSGCGLCLPPCPVDCIILIATLPLADPASPWPEYALTETQRWRARHDARRARLARRAATRSSHLTPVERERIRADITAAVARVRTRRAAAKR